MSTAAPGQWAGKYRPRKPRYFNRVQMGYEWNKYNQTHYDHENPPPKVVQGYKFNIFYPDLIDKTRTPTYRIERENGRKKGQSFAPAGEEDTCLIRFMSGPPYEDVAFRIVDKEWDYSAKRERGFRSSFDKVSCWCRLVVGLDRVADAAIIGHSAIALPIQKGTRDVDPFRSSPFLCITLTDHEGLLQEVVLPENIAGKRLPTASVTKLPLRNLSNSCGMP